MNRRDKKVEEFELRHMGLFQAPQEEMDGAATRIQQRMRSGIDRGEERLQYAGDDLVQPTPLLRKSGRAWFAAAAAIVFVVAVSVLVKTFVWSGDAFAAVELGSGPVSKSSGGKTEFLKPGEQVAAGEILQTQGGKSSIKVAGSHVEMHAQSEISLEPVDDGIRLQLNKGSVVVDARDSNSQFYVKTKDTLVSARDGVFLVAAEAAGSRVSVMQGEVRTQQGTEEKRLVAGERTAPLPRATPRLEVAFLKVNEDVVMANIALGLPYSLLPFTEDPQAQVRKATARIEGRVTDLTGRTVQRVEDSLELTVPTSSFNPTGIALWQKNLFFQQRLYRLTVLISDSNGNNIGMIDRPLRVGPFSADKLSASSLIVADRVEPVPLGSPSSFRIGNFIVRPSMNDFRRDQDLNIFQQVYVATKDLGSTLPLSMETLITLEGREVKRVSEALQRSSSMTITRKMPLSDFLPGVYFVQTAYTDAATGERVVSTAQFTVR